MNIEELTATLRAKLEADRAAVERVIEMLGPTPDKLKLELRTGTEPGPAKHAKNARGPRAGKAHPGSMRDRIEQALRSGPAEGIGCEALAARLGLTSKQVSDNVGYLERLGMLVKEGKGLKAVARMAGKDESGKRRAVSLEEKEAAFKAMARGDEITVPRDPDAGAQGDGE